MSEVDVLEEAAAAVLRAHSDHPKPGEDGFDNDAFAWAEALAAAAIGVYKLRSGDTARREFEPSSWEAVLDPSQEESMRKAWERVPCPGAGERP